MSYGTTITEPAEGAHRFGTVGDPDLGTCTACGGQRWHREHAMVERHLSAAIPDGTDLTGWYCVEASDDRGAHYAANGLRWPDREGAERWAVDLMGRWFGCTNIRVRRTTADGTPTGDTVTQTL